MEPELAEHVADVLKAMAHPLRLEIIEVLESGELSVGDIAEKVGAKQSITSQQLSRMKDRGVLSSRREGSKVYYRISNSNVLKLLDCVYNHCEQRIGGQK